MDFIALTEAFFPELSLVDTPPTEAPATLAQDAALVPSIWWGVVDAMRALA